MEGGEGEGERERERREEETREEQRLERMVGKARAWFEEQRYALHAMLQVCPHTALQTQRLHPAQSAPWCPHTTPWPP